MTHRTYCVACGKEMEWDGVSEPVCKKCQKKEVREEVSTDADPGN